MLVRITENGNVDGLHDQAVTVHIPRPARLGPMPITLSKAKIFCRAPGVAGTGDSMEFSES